MIEASKLLVNFGFYLRYTHCKCDEHETFVQNGTRHLMCEESVG